MQFIVRFVLIIFFCCSWLCPAQYTQVPDPAFEEALIMLGIDSEQTLDGQFLTADALGVTELELTIYPAIVDITGIEAFIDLDRLELAFTGCTSVDLSENVNLTSVLIVLNDQLETLDISGCAILDRVNVENNALTALNTDGNPLLRTLWCNNNAIESLDISNNLEMFDLLASRNEINTFTNSSSEILKRIALIENNLQEVDFSMTPNIEEIYVSDNQLTFLDVRNGNNTFISDFETTGNPDLECIFVDDASYSAANWTEIDATSTFVETEAECEALGVERLEAISILVYPNPVANVFFIEAGTSDITSVSVRNFSGQLSKQFSKRERRYDISELASGLYFVEVASEKGIKQVKIVKE